MSGPHLSRRTVTRALATFSALPFPAIAGSSGGAEKDGDMTMNMHRAVTTTAGPEANFLEALHEWQAAFARIYALSDTDDCTKDFNNELEEQLFSVIDQAETAIFKWTARSALCLACKLWAGTNHVDIDRDMQIAISRGDYTGIRQMIDDMAWETRVIIETALQAEDIAGVRALASV